MSVVSFFDFVGKCFGFGNSRFDESPMNTGKCLLVEEVDNIQV